MVSYCSVPGPIADGTDAGRLWLPGREKLMRLRLVTMLVLTLGLGFLAGRVPTLGPGGRGNSAAAPPATKTSAPDERGAASASGTLPASVASSPIPPDLT